MSRHRTTSERCDKAREQGRSEERKRIVALMRRWAKLKHDAHSSMLIQDLAKYIEAQS